MIWHAFKYVTVIKILCIYYYINNIMNTKTKHVFDPENNNFLVSALINGQTYF